jgi:hypothetical protein
MYSTQPIPFIFLDPRADPPFNGVWPVGLPPVFRNVGVIRGFQVPDLRTKACPSPSPGPSPLSIIPRDMILFWLYSKFFPLSCFASGSVLEVLHCPLCSPTTRRAMDFWIYPFGSVCLHLCTVLITVAARVDGSTWLGPILGRGLEARSMLSIVNNSLRVSNCSSR